MEQDAKRKKYGVLTVLAPLAGVLTIIPLAPFICRFIPPVMLGEWNFDLIVAGLIAVIIVRLIIWLVKPLMVPACVVLLGILTFNQFRDSYSFDEIFNDYKTLAYQNWMIRDNKQSDVLSLNPRLFENNSDKTTRLVKAKVNYTDSLVRNFAVKHSLESFGDYEAKYGMITRYFSLFQYINTRFKYVPDAYRDEYFASARETIQNGLGGDCDDHSILMAACLMSIGARCRLVIVQGHMYPEIYAGNKSQYDIMQQAIVQLFHNQNIERIYYHEHNDEFWINLDYTARHPGGKYLNDNVKKVIEL